MERNDFDKAAIELDVCTHHSGAYNRLDELSITISLIVILEIEYPFLNSIVSM